MNRTQSLLSFVLLFLVTGSIAYSQGISSTAFSSTTSTYSSIIGQSGTTLLFDSDNSSETTNDDGYYTGIQLGFSFNYMGNTYTSIACNANGFALLGGNNVSGNSWVPDLSGTYGTSGRPVLAPFWTDMELIEGTGGSFLGYATTGSAPNRVFTLEWNKTEWTYTSGILSMSFQIKLYENSGAVEYIYQQEDSESATQTIGTGISSAATGSGSFLTIVSNSYSSVSSTNAYTIDSRPSSNTRLSFVPFSTFHATPTSFSATNVSPSGMTLNWTNNASSAYAASIFVSTDNINFSSLTSVAMSGTGNYSKAISGLTSGVTYYFKIYAISNEGTSSPLTGSQATPTQPLSGVRQIPSANYPNIKTAIDSMAAYGVNGPLTFELGSTYTSSSEPSLPLTFAPVQGASATNVITLRPASGVTNAVISGSNSTALILLNGIDYFVIDGRPGGTGTTSQLTIENTLASTTTTIKIQADATFNTIKYCTIRGSSNSSSYGTIYFSTGTTVGNNFNTISNNDIREGTAGTLQDIGIYVTGSSTLSSHDNSILNNNIYNFGHSANATYGFYCSSAYYYNWTVTGNSFYQTAPRTVAGTSAFMYMSETGTNTGIGNVITGNYFGGTAPSCGGSACTITTSTTFYGFYNAGSTATYGTKNVSGNLMANLNITTSSTTIYLMYNLNNESTFSNNVIGSSSAASSIVINYTGTSVASVYGAYVNPVAALNENMTVSGNTIGGITMNASSTGAYAFYGLYWASGFFSSASSITNNLIGSTSVSNSINAAASGSTNGQSVRGMFLASVTANAGLNVSNNTIANLNNASTYATSGGSYTHGIFGSSGIHFIQNNTIYNLTNVAPNTSSTNTTMSVVGILEGATTVPSGLSGHIISGNKVYNITSTASTASSIWIMGVSVNASSSSSQVKVIGNSIHSLSSTSSGTSVQVGLLTFTARFLVANNMIRLGIDGSGNSLTGSISIYGMYKNGTLPITSVFNTVYVGGTSVTGGNTFCLWRSAVPTVGTDNIRNNIFQNARTNGSGTGAHICVMVGNASAANAAAASSLLTLDNNLYYHAGAGGNIGGILYTPGSTIYVYASMTAWRGASSQDAASGYSVPGLVFPTGTVSNVNLHVTGTTAARGGGSAIAGISDDFDGDSRPASFPDIGADQCGSCNATDIFAPTISYSPLANGIVESVRTVSNVSITDYSGINTSSGTKPRLYFKKSTDADTYAGNSSTDNGWKWVEANGTTSPFSFSVNYALLQSSLAVGDVVQYFVIAQDLASTPFVGVNACAFTSFPTSVNIASTSFPSANYRSYTIANALSGTINVGPSESITSITNSGGLFDVVNSRVITGNVTAVVTGNLTAETGSIALNELVEHGNGGFTLTIRPAASTTDTISGSFAGGLIRLNGADRIIIDGRRVGDQSGTNMTIINTATTGSIAAVQFSSLGIGAGATNDTLRYCTLKTGLATNSSGQAVWVGSTTVGTSGDDNDNNAITDNRILASYYGIRVIASTGGMNDNLLIRGNTIGVAPGGSAPTDTVRFTAIDLTGVANLTMDNNLIQNVNNTTSTAMAVVSLTSVTGGVVSRNTLNRCYNAASIGTSPCVRGFGIGSGVSNIRITRNVIDSLFHLQTGSGYGVAGIDIGTGLPNSGIVIDNNFFSNILSDGDASFQYGIYGIRTGYTSTSGGISMIHNTILMRGTTFTTTSWKPTTAPIGIASGSTGIDLRNNMLINNIQISPSNVYLGVSYAVYSVVGSSAFTANDYNMYRMGSNANSAFSLFNNTAQTSLGALQLASSANANSIIGSPAFIDSTNCDLHLSAVNPGYLGSPAVSSVVNNDFDNVARTVYYMGADEIRPNLSIGSQPSSATLCVGQALNLSVSVTTPVAFDDNVSRPNPSLSYQWYKGSSAISGATTSSYSISSVVTGDAGSYTCRVYASSIDSVVSSVAVVTVNTLPNISQDPVGASRCLGANMIFSGVASGTGIGYQWQKLVGSSWTDISGATATSYTIASLAAADFTSYRFIASGACAPPDTSASATLTQLNATVITTQPTATPSSVCLGANFTLSVGAQASNIGYQWRRNGNAISGATASSLSITNAQSTDFATYSVVISGDCGVVTSQNVIVSQIAPTVISAQPSSTTPQVCLGQPFTITVGASAANISYQWRKTGVAIASATNSSYSVAAATASDFASYDVIVNGTCGSVTSHSITIVQIPATVIGTEPTASTTICQGAPFNISVGASGANLSYQWQKLNGSTWTPVPGASTSAFNIGAVVVADAGSYRVVVSGTCGVVNSATAVLVVNTPIVINSHPSFSPASACTGEASVLSMTASGSITSYQWQKFDGSVWQNVSGATNSTLNFASLVIADAGSYRMVLNGPCSATTISNQASLSVQQNVQVSAHPQPVTICAGGTISFTVSTIGTVVGYQWEQDRTGSGTWTTITGATNATYTKVGASTLDSGSYRVKVTGNCSSVPVVSNVAKATVQSIFNIVGQPTWPAIPYNVGQTVTLTVTVTGTANFQWQRDQLRNGSWVNVGANLPSYSYMISTVADSGNYRCVVSGPCGATTQNTNTVQVFTCQPPVVTTQPVTPEPVCSGSSLSLSVAVNGNGQNITYQWQQDAARNGSWTVINGATNATYNKSNVQQSDDGFYRVQIISACSAVPVYSNTVSFVVLSANTVTTQPVSQTVCGGATVTMSVVVAGANPSYQWYYNGAPMSIGQNSSAQTANLVLTNVQPGTSGSYSCFVTGPCSLNGLFSNAAVLTVNTPVVLLQPQSQTGCVGTSLTFTTNISGSGLNYQWQKNQVNISGATNSSYTIASPVLSDTGSYRVIGTNSCGTATSNAAVLNMTVPASISQQPVSQSICRGSNLTLSVSINADATLPTFQWQRNGSNLSLSTYPSANTRTLTINNIQANEAGVYTCRVMSACQPVGFNSSEATIIVNPSTAISTQPVGATICEGNPFTFSVGAVGTNLSYQWIKDGTVLFGATNSTLVLSNPVASDAGSYYVIVNGSCAPTSMNSSTVSLVVNTNPRVTAANLSNQQACIGSTVVFSTSASGTGLTYQWRFNGVAITGNASATTPTLSLTNVSLASAGSYDCLIKGLCVPSGIATNAAILVVNTPIAIQTPPSSQVACTNTEVRFSVSNTGTGASYQWRFNGAAINNNPSAATATLVLSGVGTANAGTYDVVVSGTCNTVTSTAAILTVQTQLMITTQPEPQRLCAGGTITTFVAVNGTALSYQWQRDGVNITGQTNSVLTLNNALTTQSGGYRCIINGSTACGTNQQVTNTVDVIVGLAASITRQPSNVAVSYGSTISVSVEAAGLGRGINNVLQYAWYKGSTLLTDDSHYSGATTNVLTIRGVLPTDIATDYRVQAIGVCGLATSNAFALYVPTVSITSQPQATSVCDGANARLDVVAVPTPVGGTLYYQWFKGTAALSDGPNISGSTTASLILNGLTTADSGDYTCQITVQPGGSRVTSAIAHIQVNSSPVIASQPADAAACIGSSMSFSVSASGGALSYQWTKDGTALAGATNATLTINSVSAADAGVYTVSVRNSCGVTGSSVARGSIAPPPVITTQPVSQTVGLNAVFSLSVTAAGSGTLQYQWKLNGANIPGATNATLTVSGTTKDNAGSYTCEVSSECGTATSNAATIVITSTSVVDAEQLGFSLMNPEPNPVADFATIRIRVPQTSYLSVDVTDLQGRTVATLMNGVTEAGEHVRVLNAVDAHLTSGRYVVRLITAEGYMTTKSVIIVR